MAASTMPHHSFAPAMWRDLRLAVRGWALAPAFAAGTIGTLGIGMAALMSVFLLVNATLLRPLPYPESERLIVLQNAWRERPTRHPFVSAPRAMAWQEAARSVEAMAFYSPGRFVSGAVDGEPQRLSAGHVSASFFTMFGARPVRGRVFTLEEDRPGAPGVAVLSYLFWHRHLGADPEVTGRSITVNGEPSIIVGVLEADFDARSLAPGVEAPPDVWLPLRLEAGSTDDANTLVAVGRLRAVVPIELARQEAEAAAEAFRVAVPEGLPRDGTFDVAPLRSVVGGDVRFSLLMLLAAVALLAVLIVANVINLFLAKAVARRKEFAIRAALGAGRWQLTTLAAAETCVLTGVSVLLGSAAGIVLTRLLLQSQAVRLPRIGSTGLGDLVDVRVLTLAGVMWLALSLLLALIQVAAAASGWGSLEPHLRVSSRGASRPHRAHSWLLALEIALACVLVIGASLLTRSLIGLQEVNPGFERQHVVTMQTLSGDRRLAGRETALRVFDDGLQRLADLPGVHSVAVTLTGVPLAQGSALRVDVAGRPVGEQYMTSWDLVTPQYFGALGFRLVSGRSFDERDRSGATPVAMVNETMARQLWPTESPLGRHILIGHGGGPAWDEGMAREVIGVVSDVRQWALSRPPFPGTYVPLAQVPDPQLAWFHQRSAAATWIVRTAPSGGPSASALQRELQRSTALLVAEVKTMDEVFAGATASAAQSAWLMAVLGGLSMLVAVVGVFALTLYSVEQRTQEVAVRLALGARAHQVHRLVLGRMIRIALLGIAAGVAASAGCATLLRTALYDVGAHDPLVFTAVPVVLATAALAAAYLPSRRASNIDPVVILRE
jgi:putative ABC transport system permease protein